MRTLDQIEVKNEFPCIYWHEGDYMFWAAEPSHLYIGPRSSMDYLQEDGWHLIDCQGHFFDISGWEQIAPFGGLTFWFERLIGRTFAVPVLTNDRLLTLDEAKAILLKVATSRFQADPEPYILADIRGALPQAKSFLEVIHVVRPGT